MQLFARMGARLEGMPDDTRWKLWLLLAIAGAFLPIGSAIFESERWAVLTFAVFSAGALIRNIAQSAAAGVPGWMVVALFIVGMFTQIVAYGLHYKQVGIRGPDEATVRTAWECMYFSVSTWTTLGFSDFVPTPASRLAVAFEALFGYVYMALGLGVVVTFLAEERAAARALQRRH